MFCRDIFKAVEETFGVPCLSRGGKDDAVFGLLLGRKASHMLSLSEDGTLSYGSWAAKIDSSETEGLVNYLSGSFSTLYRISARIEELRGQVARNESLATVMDCAAELLGNPLILIDRSYRVIASSHCENLKDPLWEENIARGYCTYDFIVALSGLMPEIPESTPEAFVVECDQSPRHKLCSRVFWQRLPLGNILTLDSHRSIELWHREVLPIISSELSKLLHQSALFSSLVGSAGEIVLSNILSGEDAEITARRLQANSIQLPEGMCCCCIKPLPATGSRADEFLKTHLRSSFPSGYVLAHQGWIALFFAASYPEPIPLPDLEKITGLLNKYAVKIGLSSVFYSFRQVPEAFGQAQTAAEIGERLSSVGVTFYDDVKQYDLLIRYGSAHPLKNYRHPALALIRQYDALNGTELFSVLETYVNCGCHAKETAAALYMHRNTLNNRLNRIAELAKISLDDPDTVYRLAFSLWIEQLIPPATNPSG